MLEKNLLIVTSLFTMINPLRVVPIFILLTDPFSPKENKRVVIKASLVSFISLTLFALSGKVIFDFFLEFLLMG